MGEVSVQVTKPQRRPARRPGPSQVKMYGFCHLFRAMKTFTALVGLHRDSDLTESIDHAQCCTLHAMAQLLYGRGAFEPVERTTGRGTAICLNCRTDEKNTTSFH